MKSILTILIFSAFSLFSSSSIDLNISDHVFIKHTVPKRGITSSNRARIKRLSHFLKEVKVYTCSWGPKVYIGKYQGEEIFLALAPVGSGSGLVFTELYSAGAEYIIRYGSDDKKLPPQEEYHMIKVVDEADNLYGFSLASGIPYEECGRSLFASPVIIEALEKEAKHRNLTLQKCVCHHLENYHALRNPQKFKGREGILTAQQARLKRDNKAESLDMETAVLFQVAKDFKKHAATVLQTVIKSDPYLEAYQGVQGNDARALESQVFAHYLLSSLLRIPLL